MSGRPSVDAVLLTMNDRAAELRLAIESLLSQRDVDLRIVIVGNGCEPDYVPPGVTAVSLPENLGIPGGRNVGAEALAGEDAAEFILFFDNDAVLPDPDTVARLAAEFDRHPDAAYVQPRIVGPASGTTLGRWVPRLRPKDAATPGAVTVMPEGIVLDSGPQGTSMSGSGAWPRACAAAMASGGR